MQQQLDQGVMHHRQAGVAARDDLLRLDPKQLGEHLAQLAQPVQPAVVAHVDPVRILDRGRQLQQPVGQVQLRAAGLATSQVQLESSTLECVVCRALLLDEGSELGWRALGEWGLLWCHAGHADHPSMVGSRHRAGSRMLIPRCLHQDFGMPVARGSTPPGPLRPIQERS